MAAIFGRAALSLGSRFIPRLVSRIAPRLAKPFTSLVSKIGQSTIGKGLKFALNLAAGEEVLQGVQNIGQKVVEGKNLGQIIKDSVNLGQKIKARRKQIGDLGQQFKRAPSEVIDRFHQSYQKFPRFQNNPRFELRNKMSGIAQSVPTDQFNQALPQSKGYLSENIRNYLENKRGPSLTSASVLASSTNPLFKQTGKSLLQHGRQNFNNQLMMSENEQFNEKIDQPFEDIGFQPQVLPEQQYERQQRDFERGQDFERFIEE